MARMYYPDALSSAASTLKVPLTPEETVTKTALIIKLLKVIHVCAAAEAISFTRHLGLDLEQMYDLTKDAAGGSREFQGAGWEMIKTLKGEAGWEGDGVTGAVAARVKDLEEVVAEARKLECPLYLGTEALNLCLMALKANKEARDSALPQIWI
jgi:3-hydroxyisobutyrate dehydrogenase